MPFPYGRLLVMTHWSLMSFCEFFMLPPLQPTMTIVRISHQQLPSSKCKWSVPWFPLESHWPESLSRWYNPVPFHLAHGNSHILCLAQLRKLDYFQYNSFPWLLYLGAPNSSQPLPLNCSVINQIPAPVSLTRGLMSNFSNDPFEVLLLDLRTLFPSSTGEIDGLLTFPKK